MTTANIVKTMASLLGWAMLFIVVLFGVAFISILVHEGVHVYHGYEAEIQPTGVGLAFNTKISDEEQQGQLVAFTTFDFASAEYTNLEVTAFREYTEKVAGIVGTFTSAIIALLVGILIGIKAKRS